MSRPAGYPTAYMTQRLVEKIRRLDAEMGEARRELVAQRRAAIAELFELVGAAEAARLLGITPAAIYKSIYAGRN